MLFYFNSLALSFHSRDFLSLAMRSFLIDSLFWTLQLTLPMYLPPGDICCPVPGDLTAQEMFTLTQCS